MGLEQTPDEYKQRLRYRRIATLHDLGFVEDYKRVWEFQKRILDERIQNKLPDTIILVEHEHVLTRGRNSSDENLLRRDDLPLFDIERGGDITYHGPGQLVVYPIISLQDLSLGIRQYVELLQMTIIDALTHMGLLNCKGKLGKLTGVWVDDSRKIASIGVAVSHWVAYHGFALNVNTDLSYFEKIRPCGFEANIMTSISKEQGVGNVDMQLVKRSLLLSFSDRFGFDFHASNQLD